MKRVMFLIPRPHSIIDVITNSSSELFIFKTDRSLRIIKEMLNDLLETYRKSSDYANRNLDFKDFDSAYGDIFIISDKIKKEDLFGVMKNIMGFGSPDESRCKEFGLNKTTYPEYNYTKDFDWKKHEAAENKWLKANLKSFIDHCDGMTVVYSKTDNSIPWPVMEFITAMICLHLKVGSFA